MEYAVLNCGTSIKKERVESLSPSLMVELLCHIAERLTLLPVEKLFSPLRRISGVSTSIHTPPSLQTALDSHVTSVSTMRLISLMYFFLFCLLNVSQSLRIIM